MYRILNYHKSKKARVHHIQPNQLLLASVIKQLQLYHQIYQLKRWLMQKQH